MTGHPTADAIIITLDIVSVFCFAAMLLATRDEWQAHQRRLERARRWPHGIGNNDD